MVALLVTLCTTYKHDYAAWLRSNCLRKVAGGSVLTGSLLASINMSSPPQFLPFTGLPRLGVVRLRPGKMKAMGLPAQLEIAYEPTDGGGAASMGSTSSSRAGSNAPAHTLPSHAPSAEAT